MTEQKIKELENELSQMEDNRDDLQILVYRTRDMLQTIEQEYEQVEQAYAYLHPKDTNSLFARNIQKVRTLLDVTNRFVNIELKDTEQ